MELFSRRGPQSENNAAYLRDIYRAFTGEMNDVAEYSLLAMRAAAQFPAAARLFDELARVELAHLSQLGQLLLRYGVTPTLQHTVRRGKTDNGSFRAEDPAALESVFEARISEEREGAENYRRLASVAQNRPEARLFRELASEEEEHATALEGLAMRMKQS